MEDGWKNYFMYVSGYLFYVSEIIQYTLYKQLAFLNDI